MIVRQKAFCTHADLVAEEEQGRRGVGLKLCRESAAMYAVNRAVQGPGQVVGGAVQSSLFALSMLSIVSITP